MALLEERVRLLDQEVNGGPAVEWKRSLRGRVHEVENELDAARLARQALDEVRRARRHDWTARERHGALLIGLVGVATPYVLLALHWIHSG